jgi:phosphoglycerate kinase
VLEPAGEIVLFENVRFNKGEKTIATSWPSNTPSLCDVAGLSYDGHRSPPRVRPAGVAKFAKVACAGPLLAAELTALLKALGALAKPMAVIVACSCADQA